MKQGGKMENIYGVDGFRVESIEDLEYIYSKYFENGDFASLMYYLELPKYISQNYNAKSVYQQILEWHHKVDGEDIDACLLAEICKGKTRFTKENFADYFKVVSAENSSYDFTPLHKLSDKRIEELKERLQELDKDKKQQEWSRSLQDNRDDIYDIYGKSSQTEEVDYDDTIRDLGNEIDFVNSLISGKPIMNDIECLVRGFSGGRDYFDDIRSILYGEKTTSGNKTEEKTDYIQPSFFDALNRDDK